MLGKGGRAVHPSHRRVRSNLAMAMDKEKDVPAPRACVEDGHGTDWQLCSFCCDASHGAIGVTSPGHT